MGKGIYLGVNGAARKMKRAYIGVDGRARKVKKIYVGVEGKARLCYSAGLEKAGNQYGLADELASYRYGLAAATVGNHALFAGGYGSPSGESDSRRDTVDAYDTSLTHTMPTALSTPRYDLAGISFGNYALFGGGQGGANCHVVDVYDTALTRSRPGSYLQQARHDLAGTACGSYALFGGGHNVTLTSNSSYKSWAVTPYNNVEAYNTSLSRQTTSLSQARGGLAAAAVGGYMLFAGGDSYATPNGVHQVSNYQPRTPSAVVDAFNASLTRTTATSLSVARYDLAATTIGGYALFGGGNTSTGGKNAPAASAVVDVYNASLTRTTATALSGARYELAATTVGDYALFGGGYNTSNWGTVDVYDTSLTRTTGPNLFTERHCLAATTVGDFALFGGGILNTTMDNSVDVYTA